MNGVQVQDAQQHQYGYIRRKFEIERTNDDRGIKTIN